MVDATARLHTGAPGAAGEKVHATAKSSRDARSAYASATSHPFTPPSHPSPSGMQPRGWDHHRLIRTGHGTTRRGEAFGWSVVPAGGEATSTDTVRPWRVGASAVYDRVGLSTPRRGDSPGSRRTIRLARVPLFGRQSGPGCLHVWVVVGSDLLRSGRADDVGACGTNSSGALPPGRSQPTGWHRRKSFSETWPASTLAYPPAHGSAPDGVSHTSRTTQHFFPHRLPADVESVAGEVGGDIFRNVGGMQ